MALHAPGSAFKVTFAGQPVIVGAVLSAAVIVTLQVVEFPAASVAVIVTTWIPRFTRVPASGNWFQLSEEEQSSVPAALGRRSGSAALHRGPTRMFCEGGQVVITGAVLSPTCTVWIPLRADPHPATSTRARYCVVTNRFEKGNVAVVLAIAELVTKPSVLINQPTIVPVYPERVNVPELLPGQSILFAEEVTEPPTGAA